MSLYGNDTLYRQDVALMDLLASQCSDMEAVLGLARRETLAAEKGDFREMVAVAQERAALHERLESCYRRIAEVRAFMGSAAEPAIRGAIAERALKLTIDIETQDARTTSLMICRR